MNGALLSHGQVAAMLGLKRDALYAIRKNDPSFPKPLVLPGLSHPKWTREMVTVYIERKAREAWDATRRDIRDEAHA